MRSLFSELIAVPQQSSLMLYLTIAYFFLASIITFSKRIWQAEKRGELDSGEPIPPDFIGGLVYIDIPLKIALLVLNWKYGIFLYIVGFVLAVTPVLETIGNVLLRPLRRYARYAP